MTAGQGGKVGGRVSGSEGGTTSQDTAWPGMLEPEPLARHSRSSQAAHVYVSSQRQAPGCWPQPQLQQPTAGK